MRLGGAVFNTYLIHESTNNIVVYIMCFVAEFT